MFPSHAHVAVQTIAERIPSATVMFLCIENLIDMTSSLTTSKSIQLMNDLFDVCDKRAGRVWTALAWQRCGTLADMRAIMCRGIWRGESEDHQRQVHVRVWRP